MATCRTAKRSSSTPAMRGSCWCPSSRARSSRRPQRPDQPIVKGGSRAALFVCPRIGTNRPMSNPFFETWSTPYGVPPFDAIETSHFKPAYTQALAEHDKEIDKIAAQSDAPSFDNTIAALETAGKLLRQVEMTFGQLSSAHTNDELQAVEREVVPLVTRHWTSIYLNPKLFARIDELYQRRSELGLDPESLRVLE